MKQSIILAVIFLTNLAMAVDAPGFRVGYVDLQKSLESVEAGKNAKKSLEKEVTSKKVEIEKEQQKLQTDMEEFEKKAAILNEASRAQKQKELQKRLMDFQKSAQESQLELQKKERDLTKPIIDELKAIIHDLGKEKGLHLILEKNEGAVLYAESGTDLTTQVIEKFNSKNKGKK